MRVNRVVIGLIVGLIVGSAVRATQSPIALRFIAAVAPLGQLWLNALRMTVIPLVISLLFVAIATVDETASVRRTAVAMIGAWFVLLVLAAVLAILVCPPLIRDFHFSPDSATALRAFANGSGPAATNGLPTASAFGAWLTSVVPANAIRSAADDALLPLLIFTFLFALATRRIESKLRKSLVDVFGAIGRATGGVVEWVLAVAPIGVFAIMATMTSRLGGGPVGAMTYYILAYAAAVTLFALLIYSVAAVAGGVPLPTFSRAALGAQTIAVSTGSSVASLPALFDATRRLGIEQTTSGFVVPLSLSALRVATPIGWVLGALFLAKLYGATLGTGAVLSVALMSVVLSFAVPGIPHSAPLLLATVLPAVGVPTEGIALLVAADVIPDLFAAMAEVTGDLVVVALVARRTKLSDVADDVSEEASSADA